MLRSARHYTIKCVKDHYLGHMLHVTLSRCDGWSPIACMITCYTHALQSHMHPSWTLQICQCQLPKFCQRSGSTNTICKVFTLPTATLLSRLLQHTMTTFHRIESQHWIQHCALDSVSPHKPTCPKHHLHACRFTGRFTIPVAVSSVSCKLLAPQVQNCALN